MVDVHLHEIERMIWLGEQRGCLTDWLTQRWVIATDRKISLTEYPWLEGPIGKTRRIGSDFFVNYARASGGAFEQTAKLPLRSDMREFRKGHFD